MESLKNLFMALIAVIVSKMAEVKEGLSNRIDELSNELSSLKTYVEGKIPKAFEAINTLSDRVTSEVLSLSTSIENLNTALTAKINDLRGELTTYIKAEVASLVQKIGEDDGRLQELVDNVTALAQADQGLVSTAGYQNFNDDQKTIARENIGAVSTMEFRNLNNDLNYLNNRTNERIDAIEKNSVDYEALRNELEEFIKKEFESRGL